MSKGGFSHAGQVFDKQMAIGQHAGKRELQLFFFAQYHTPHLGQGFIQCLHGSPFKRHRLDASRVMPKRFLFTGCIAYATSRFMRYRAPLTPGSNLPSGR
jgi:hypothetical protein